MTNAFLRATSLAAGLAVCSSALLAQTARTPVHHATTPVHRAAKPASCPVPLPTLSPNIPALAPTAPKCPEVEYALTYIDTRIGTGELAQARKWYTVHYTGYLLDGTKFDSSVDRGEPITFPYGAHRVIPGWDTGFEGMHVGGKRRLFIPYELAYGDAGRPPVIPPKAELVFDVELISQSDTPPAPKTPPAAPAAPAAPKPATPDQTKPGQSQTAAPNTPAKPSATPSTPPPSTPPQSNPQR